MGRPQDEIDDTIQPGPEDQTPDQTGQQDFALRNVAMSNALPATPQPAAGAAIGSGGELEMDPNVDDNEVADANDATSSDPRRE